MLQPEYKRDMHKNYIILKDKNAENRMNYGMKMVANNQIPGFLEVELHSVDQVKEYFYDITEKQPMDILFRKEALKERQIKSILSEIIVTLKRSREYLLLEDNFVLLPEYIYMNLDGTETKLIYFSGYEENIGEQLLRLIEYMMDKVDYKDKAAVFLIYGIYKVSREEGCTFDRLLEFLHNNESLEEEFQKLELAEKEIWEEEEQLIDMEEEIESEEEKKKYPLWVWIGCGISALISICLIIVAVKMGLMFDLVTGKLLYGKMAAVFGVVGALEAYCLLRILDEKNLVAYIDKKSDYVKPVEEKRKGKKQNVEKENIRFTSIPIEKVEDYQVENEQATVVLAEKGYRYALEPERAETYMPIYIPEFPFFIGTLKTKVDYAINSRNVSRFHAKLEQEGERFYLMDLNSTNGTFINGEQLDANERKEIILGDMISFADVTYRFCRG